MTLRDLIKNWETTSSTPHTDEQYSVHLPKNDAAKIAALTEMYPGRTKEQIITELLGAALNELEHTLPYIEGDKVTAVDELGDPIYEDVGPTSKFATLTRKHLSNNQQH